jgi:hypothetical protein
MATKTIRMLAVRQALANPNSQPPSLKELQLLTQYILGNVSREETNDQLLLGARLHLLSY